MHNQLSPLNTPAAYLEVGLARDGGQSPNLVGCQFGKMPGTMKETLHFNAADLYKMNRVRDFELTD